ncbi:MAG: sensor histidine kinase [Pseudoclavibacter sp.]
MDTAQAPADGASARAGLLAWATDALIAFVVFVTAFGPLVRSMDSIPPIGYVCAGLPVALMLVRQRYPWVVLVGCAVGFIGASLTIDLTPFSALPTGIAVFTIATRAARRTVLFAVLGALAVMIPASVLHEWASSHQLTILVVVMVGFFAAAGDAIRSRRAYIEQITQRAVEAEQTREAEASRRVAEDRLRIARDLHDALAHQISVINLHAAVARRTVDADPETAKTALVTVSTAARRMLGEIGTLLSALRASDDSQPLAPGAETGLRQMNALIDEFEASGLRVTTRLDGTHDDLPTPVDLAGYRLLHEALTNAQKHGSESRAHLWIERNERHLRIVVTNPASDRRDAGAPPGHGLLGIRERVTAVGGELHAGQQGAVYRIDAVLPLGPGNNSGTGTKIGTNSEAAG